MFSSSQPRSDNLRGLLQTPYTGHRFDKRGGSQENNVTQLTSLGNIMFPIG